MVGDLTDGDYSIPGGSNNMVDLSVIDPAGKDCFHDWRTWSRPFKEVAAPSNEEDFGAARK